MNSKEALDNLVHCKSITRCKECRHKSLCTMERDFNIIKQDLDRLEKLEKENELLKLDNQDLHNQIKKNVKEHYKEFMEDYDCLLEEYHELYKVWEKLKKVIEILKDYFEIWLNYEEEEIFGGFEINGYHQINKQEYELLKEVLGNEKGM